MSLRWLIEQLPAEPFQTWRYDTFVKLIGPDGQTLAQTDTPSVVGSTWVVGEEVQTATRLTIPNELKSGQYKLQVSLYDRVQAKNDSFVETSSAARNPNFEVDVYVE